MIHYAVVKNKFYRKKNCFDAIKDKYLLTYFVQLILPLIKSLLDFQGF